MSRTICEMSMSKFLATKYQSKPSNSNGFWSDPSILFYNCVLCGSCEKRTHLSPNVDVDDSKVKGWKQTSGLNRGKIALGWILILIFTPSRVKGENGIDAWFQYSPRERLRTAMPCYDPFSLEE